jgi:periplasmic protein TonB
MFDELLASRPRRQRPLGGTIASVTGHAALILLAVQATASTREASARPEQPPDVIYQRLADDDPSPTARGPASRPAAGRPTVPSMPREPFQSPVEIPVGLPPIDPAAPVVDALDFRASSGSTGVAGNGDANVSGGAGAGGAFLPGAVERPALLAPGSPPPRYPEPLRRAAVGGRVVVRFVIDTLGRAEMGTVRVLDSDHELFARAVRAILPAYRFIPAETGGRKVRMWVDMPFVFEMDGER